MIEPMKKVSIVILNKEKETALLALRKIGLVHLEKVEGNNEKLTAFKECMNNANVSISILSEDKKAKKFAKNKKAKKPELTDEEVIKLTSEIVSKNDRKKQLFEEISADTNELERFKKWGTVELEDIAYLKEKDIYIRMFEIPSNKYMLIDKEIKTLLVNDDGKTIRFLLLECPEGRPENLLPEAFEVPLPRISTTLLEEEIKKDKQEVSDINKFFKDNSKYLSAITKYTKNLQSDIEFENINAGMYHENDGTENELAWISGFVPAADIKEFADKCKENHWALAYEDAERDDPEVPTKLRNNKFVSLIYPLTDFLGTVPGYNEFDISGWFLLFFSIFFGMIFGDGGYGLLVLVATLFLMIKAKCEKKPFQPVFGLVLILGLSTTIWGLVTCTWFGLKPEQLPQWLVDLSIPMISNACEDAHWIPVWVTDPDLYLTTAQNLQIFCFSLALLQLTIAHIKVIIANRKSLKVIGDIGSLMQLIGIFWLVLSMVVNSKIFPMMQPIELNGKLLPVGKVELYLVFIGFGLSFIFSNYEGSIIKSILASVKNIISVLLGVVNVFSDIVSYIRLWAVGLAGAAISNTVNEMAGPLLGHALTFIAFVALIVFGHGLNMILNLLSVIVHGVRLNTLEFSTHLGMSWSGFKYEPFREKGKK